MIADKIFLTRGVGVHKEELTSFKMALHDAGIAPFNLVYVSSIYPPHCKYVAREKGLEYLKPGAIVYCVMAKNATSEPYRLTAASIGLAIPADRDVHGYISEHHCFGQSKFKTGEYAEDLAASMLASTLGIEFDPDQAWDEREQLFKMSGKIVKTRNITQSAQGNKNGLWTTVIAAAVFVCSK
ncbi:MAG: arginine decarboxylase, pyruvoyl-dependent [Candidatus Azambacteria bacterium]|nr:arginine decarboxylase, pyruvoyl-dependent [Candidatus Azambacteria bacterium]